MWFEAPFLLMCIQRSKWIVPPNKNSENATSTLINFSVENSNWFVFSRKSLLNPEFVHFANIEHWSLKLKIIEKPNHNLKSSFCTSLELWFADSRFLSHTHTHTFSRSSLQFYWTNQFSLCFLFVLPLNLAIQCISCNLIEKRLQLGKIETWNKTFKLL